MGGLHEPGSPLRLECLGIPVSAVLETVCLNECGYFMWNLYSANLEVDLASGLEIRIQGT